MGDLPNWGYQNALYAPDEGWFCPTKILGQIRYTEHISFQLFDQSWILTLIWYHYLSHKVILARNSYLLYPLLPSFKNSVLHINGTVMDGVKEILWHVAINSWHHSHDKINICRYTMWRFPSLLQLATCFKNSESERFVFDKKSRLIYRLDMWF